MFISIIVPFSILLPILIALFNYKSANIEAKLLFYYLVISGLINLTALILVEYRMRNLPLLHLYTLIEAVFLLSYFRSIFKDKIIKKALLILIVLFPILCILNFTFLQSIYTFNTYTRPLEAILITFFCLLYLYRSGFTENWLQKPINWFNMGILIYFPAGFIIFTLSNYLVANPNKSMNTMVWSIHAVLVLLMYLTWARGFSLIKKDG
ncbi:MAG: hypothetical protein V4541_12620 [Bacteroidota bacterium]